MANRLHSITRWPSAVETARAIAITDIGFVNAIHQINFQAGNFRIYPELDRIAQTASGVLLRLSK